MENIAQGVLYSTPVSVGRSKQGESQKFKATRFILPEVKETGCNFSIQMASNEFSLFKKIFCIKF